MKSSYPERGVCWMNAEPGVGIGEITCGMAGVCLVEDGIFGKDCCGFCSSTDFTGKEIG